MAASIRARIRVHRRRLGKGASCSRRNPDTVGVHDEEIRVTWYLILVMRTERAGNGVPYLSCEKAGAPDRLDRGKAGNLDGSLCDKPIIEKTSMESTSAVHANRGLVNASIYRDSASRRTT